MWNDNTAFIIYTEMKNSFVLMANKQKVLIRGSGTIQINIDGFTLRTHEAYCIPTLAYCMYSDNEYVKYGKYFTHFGNNKAILSFPIFKFTIFNGDDLYIHAWSLMPSTNKIHWDSTDYSTHKAWFKNTPQQLLSCKQKPSDSAHRQITNIDLHRYVGFLTLKKIKYFDIASKPTVTVIDARDIPLEIDVVSNLQCTNRNTTPLEHPTLFFDVANIDITYGNITAPGWIKYTLIIDDRKTRFTYTPPQKMVKNIALYLH